MEFIFEILYEIIFEGSLEIGTSKKAPILVRILAMAVFFAINGLFLAVFLLISLEIMKKSVVLGWMVILFDCFLLGCLVSTVRKKIKK